jgi:hypothetical protein
MEARAVFEERTFSGLREDGEGLEGGRRVAIICEKEIGGNEETRKRSASGE